MIKYDSNHRRSVMANHDAKVSEDFGHEWSKFDQSRLSPEEFCEMFHAYFHIFPWDRLPGSAVGFDLGCGSGRWAKFVAPRVEKLHCIDPSEKAIQVARKNLSGFGNVLFHVNSVDTMPMQDGSMDFGYCLGVLHHVPDTTHGLQSCVSKLKPGAPLLVYLYYAFDNRSVGFKMLWKTSDAIRQVICRLPSFLKFAVCEIIAALVYYPFAKMAGLFERLGRNVDGFPLAQYRNKSFYTMRTDALDRFGTRLEKRFAKNEIESMMMEAGLVDLQFSENAPYWCVVGYKSVK